PDATRGHTPMPTRRSSDLWSAACPECGQQLSANDQREHLLSAHGYIDLAGIVLPPAAALTCLWDRVFTTGDVQAHDRLCRLLARSEEHTLNSSHQIISYAV